MIGVPATRSARMIPAAGIASQPDRTGRIETMTQTAFRWTLLIGANVLMWGVLSLYETTGGRAVRTTVAVCQFDRTAGRDRSRTPGDQRPAPRTEHPVAVGQTQSGRRNPVPDRRIVQTAGDAAAVEFFVYDGPSGPSQLATARKGRRTWVAGAAGVRKCPVRI